MASSHLDRRVAATSAEGFVTEIVTSLLQSSLVIVAIWRTNPVTASTAVPGLARQTLVQTDDFVKTRQKDSYNLRTVQAMVNHSVEQCLDTAIIIALVQELILEQKEGFFVLE